MWALLLCEKVMTVDANSVWSAKQYKKNWLFSIGKAFTFVLLRDSFSWKPNAKRQQREEKEKRSENESRREFSEKKMGFCLYSMESKLDKEESSMGICLDLIQ